MTIENDRLKKKLISQKRKVDTDIKASKENISHLQRELALKAKHSKDLQEKIDSIMPKKLQITEHAMLRYFERVCGFDLKAIEEGIVSSGIDERYHVLGDTYELNTGEYKVVVKNNRIVTIK